MARKKKSQFVLGETTKKFLEDIKIILDERGATGVDLGALIDIIVSKRNAKDVDLFVSQNTPFDYKLKKLMENDKAMSVINKLVDQHHFGLSSSI